MKCFRKKKFVFLTTNYDRLRNPEAQDPTQNPHSVIENRPRLDKVQCFVRLRIYLLSHNLAENITKIYSYTKSCYQQTLSYVRFALLNTIRDSTTYNTKKRRHSSLEIQYVAIGTYEYIFTQQISNAITHDKWLRIRESLSRNN